MVPDFTANQIEQQSSCVITVSNNFKIRPLPNLLATQIEKAWQSNNSLKFDASHVIFWKKNARLQVTRDFVFDSYLLEDKIDANVLR